MLYLVFMYTSSLQNDPKDELNLNKHREMCQMSSPTFFHEVSPSQTPPHSGDQNSQKQHLPLDAVCNTED